MAQVFEEFSEKGTCAKTPWPWPSWQQHQLLLGGPRPPPRPLSYPSPCSVHFSPVLNSKRHVPGQGLCCFVCHMHSPRCLSGWCLTLPSNLYSKAASPAMLYLVPSETASPPGTTEPLPCPVFLCSHHHHLRSSAFPSLALLFTCVADWSVSFVRAGGLAYAKDSEAGVQYRFGELKNHHLPYSVHVPHTQYL